MPGRPRILCDTKKREVCALVAAGCTIAAAARYVGCSPLTIQREARRNAQFEEGLRALRITAELHPVTTVRDAAKHEWRAAAWLLERTQPQRYGKRAANSFSREEVTELLSRVCDVVRQEARDAQQFARIKRRILTLTQKSIRPTIVSDADAKPTTPPQPLPPSPPADEPAHAPAISNSPAPTPADEHATDQNATEKEPVLICLADMPPGNSSPFAAQQLSK